MHDKFENVYTYKDLDTVYVPRVYEPLSNKNKDYIDQRLDWKQESRLGDICFISYQTI
jgi:hypothetical protein